MEETGIEENNIIVIDRFDIDEYFTFIYFLLVQNVNL